MDMPPNNAFAATFIETLGNTIEWPCTLIEGDYTGPWSVVSHGSAADAQTEQWAVVRLGDEKPFLITPFWEIACMIAAVLPLLGRHLAYALHSDSDDGFSEISALWESGLSSVGRIRSSGSEAISPLNLMHSLLVSPVSLAYLLIAAPADVLQRTGLFMAKLLEEGTQSGKNPPSPNPEQE